MIFKRHPYGALETGRDVRRPAQVVEMGPLSLGKNLVAPTRQVEAGCLGQPQEKIADAKVRKNAGVQDDFEVRPNQVGPAFGFGKYKSA